MQRVLSFLEKRVEVFKEQPFFQLLRGVATSEEAREVAPAFVFFSFAFQDMLRLNAERVRSARVRSVIEEHRREEVGHERWIYHDIQNLGLDASVGAVFAPKYEAAREAAYSIINEILHARSDEVRLVLLLTLEATVDVFLADAVGFFKRAGVGDGLLFFGEKHVAAEEGHSIFDCDVVLEAQLSSAVRADAERLIDRVLEILSHWLTAIHDGLVAARNGLAAS